MELVDYNGKTRKLSDFSKVVVAFFGFTQCPTSARPRWPSWPRP